jgi:hypothetical protein
MSHVGKGPEEYRLDGNSRFSPQLNSLITVLSDDAGAAEINQALQDYDIVYLRPGEYTLTAGTDHILIPSGKSLEGIRPYATNQNPTVDPAAFARIVWVGGLPSNGDLVQMEEKTTLRNIDFDASPAATFTHGDAYVNADIPAQSGNASGNRKSRKWSVVENCQFAGFSAGHPQTDMIRITNGIVRGCTMLLTGTGGACVHRTGGGSDLLQSGARLVVENNGMFGNVGVRLSQGFGFGSFARSSAYIKDNVISCSTGVYSPEVQTFVDVHVIGNRFNNVAIAGRYGIQGFQGASDNVLIAANSFAELDRPVNLATPSGNSRPVFRDNVTRDCINNNPLGTAGWVTRNNTTA